MLTRYCSIRLTSCAGSRWAPGSATARRAPVINGQKNSQTDTSKLNGVFCNTVSRPSSGYAPCIHAKRLYKASWWLAAPLGLPVEPEV
ncbi:hypothetical protein D9M71_208400 [compost metagenome]